ncbi:DUF6538 domain-containing protein [Sedimentimonas flavescens]|uniref:DUF6538 domain-containing protein n=1 Tax=Sedimentimonas flavescens TaxID=2851012 RepID=UPI00384CF24E
MVILYEAGAIRVMCKHIQLKDNTWYYRRRVPKDVLRLHHKRGTLFFSLKTTDKQQACRMADAETRRLDSLWKAHREGVTGKVMSEQLGLRPGRGLGSVLG